MIVRRRLDFDFDPGSVPRDWYQDDPHLTTMWSALSLAFPEGERFFVESVRRYRDRIEDPELLSAIEGFGGQEAMHAKAHRLFNEMLQAQGLGDALPAAEKRVRWLLNVGRRVLPHKAQLAVTVALEHFTAILAEQLLSNEKHRAAGHPSVHALWEWHAFEESEHKAVSFDVYRAVGGTYAMRVRVMLMTTALFMIAVLLIHARFLHARGKLGDVRGWARTAGFLWVRPGLFRELVPAYWDFFRPGFHPNDRDTRALVAEWSERLFGTQGTLRDQLHAAA